MRRRRQSIAFDGQARPGAYRWPDLPGYVQERVNKRPWDDTEGDRRIQAVAREYFVAVNPSGWKEIWVATPPGNRNGISKLCNVTFDGQTPADIVDGWIALVIKDLKRRDHDAKAYAREILAGLERLKTDKEAQARLERRIMGENVVRDLMDWRKAGRIARPSRSIIVPARLGPAVAG